MVISIKKWEKASISLLMVSAKQCNSWYLICVFGMTCCPWFRVEPTWRLNSGWITNDFGFAEIIWGFMKTFSCKFKCIKPLKKIQGKAANYYCIQASKEWVYALKITHRVQTIGAFNVHRLQNALSFNELHGRCYQLHLSERTIFIDKNMTSSL